jgi:hypothetical protein
MLIDDDTPRTSFYANGDAPPHATSKIIPDRPLYYY